MLVAGFGIPARRDLDFGTQLVKVLDGEAWPPDVLIEDLSYSPHLVLHRLKELRPRKLVLVGAVARGVGGPGTIRRRCAEPDAVVVPDMVHQGLVDSVSGAADLDHTLAVLHHWGGLPPETVLMEVEPGDCGFGVGFSEDLVPCVDRIVALIREELDDDPTLDVAEPVLVDADAPAPAHPRGLQISDELRELVAFAEHRRRANAEERARHVPPRRFPGLEVVWRSRPWGINVESGSDWHDVLPLNGGLLGVVVGDVPGRGAAAAALKSDVRMAVRAYALLEGYEPARLVACLDRLSVATGRGELTTLTYFTIHPETGEVRLCTAGQCPPLIIESQGAPSRRSGTQPAWYLHDSFTAPIGANGTSRRHEIETRLSPGSTVVAFTDGLVLRAGRTMAQGLADLREAAAGGTSQPLEGLCDHLGRTAMDRRRRDDDASLLGLRLT